MEYHRIIGKQQTDSQGIDFTLSQNENGKTAHKKKKLKTNKVHTKSQKAFSELKK